MDESIWLYIFFRHTRRNSLVPVFISVYFPFHALFYWDVHFANEMVCVGFNCVTGECRKYGIVYTWNLYLFYMDDTSMKILLCWSDSFGMRGKLFLLCEFVYVCFVSAAAQQESRNGERKTIKIGFYGTVCFPQNDSMSQNWIIVCLIMITNFTLSHQLYGGCRLLTATTNTIRPPPPHLNTMDFTCRDFPYSSEILIQNFPSAISQLQSVVC